MPAPGERLENQPEAVDLEAPAFVSAYDELPLWSAPFGLALLQHVPLGAGLRVLDVGCGTGFPLIELAERLGSFSEVWGIDPWQAALERAKAKASQRGVTNLRLVRADAAWQPFPDGFFDLLVSNLGLNNFAEPDRVLAECRRTLKPGGCLALTTNFRGHMSELYLLFADVLAELHPESLEKLEAHVAHRSDPAAIRRWLEEGGFRITATHTDSFVMRFVDGSALLRHSFIRLAFLPAWRDLVPIEAREVVLRWLEERLNAHARDRGELALTIPYGYVQAVRP